MAITTPETLGLTGICGVCALDGTCEPADRSSARIMRCEQFQPDPDLVCEMVTSVITSRTYGASDFDSVNHMGLCTNCEHRGDCAFPRREGGVWYCEEYR